MTLEHKVYDAPELLGELLLFEIAPAYCRESGSLKAPSAALPMGTVLMQNADGTLGPWTPAAPAAEGQTAEPDSGPVGVLLRDVQASSSNVEAPVLRRGALVSASLLNWPADTAEEQKKAALAALEDLGIVAR